MSALPIHIALHVLDFSLHSNELRKEPREILSLTALLIGAKFQEHDQSIPYIEDLQKQTTFRFNRDQIVACEGRILRELNWNLMF